MKIVISIVLTKAKVSKEILNCPFNKLNEYFFLNANI